MFGRPPAAIVLALLILLAGCSAFDGEDPTTTDPGPTVTFELDIDGTVRDAHYFEIRLVEGPVDEVTVTYRNGTTEVRQVDGRSSRYGGDGTAVTDVDSGLEAVDVIAFSGPPNATIRNPDVTPAATAIYVIRASGADAYRAWGVLKCRDGFALTAVTFHVLESGIDGPGVACSTVS
ncbi:MAG: hypothetical protein ACI9YT_003090 [Halobacteriales archaeon]|jgi:hypothetical protein